ncbi:hypothetical protein QEV83_12730 [Methylocapsa sp. D3K7]|uniref:hypothetical protein n=1 Tax=Methylocapsa sp. D3K7 TaxID=3041435 RepID=UPI00244EA011|nr:hypothetical protein [Methylocapsa sp. D3K7]WGJ13555.1 hypothetical protein QEV83_12730 [Methylocapsa sp. D3K7]
MIGTIGACLLLASWLVSSQVKRIQSIMARVKAEEEAARGVEAGASGAGETPRS